MDYRRSSFTDYSSNSPRGLLSQNLSFTSPMLNRTSPISLGANQPLSPLSRRSLLLSSTMGMSSMDRSNSGNIFPSDSFDRGLRASLSMRSDFSSSVPAAASLRLQPRRRPRLASASSSRAVYQRKRFLVFMKVLLKCLKRDIHKSPQALRIYHQAKAVIADCTQRNRYKDPHYCPLPEAIERGLRPLVGEAQWKRAHACLDLYLEKRTQMRPRMPATTTAGGGVTMDPLQVSFPEICRAPQQARV